MGFKQSVFFSGRAVQQLHIGGTVPGVSASVRVAGRPAVLRAAPDPPLDPPLKVNRRTHNVVSSLCIFIHIYLYDLFIRGFARIFI